MTLGHTIVTAKGATPSGFILFLHGVLGRRTNWATFAKALVAARPAFGALLVDLRLHGDSQDVLGPHTVALAATDLAALDAVAPAPIVGVLGHSLGGKIALHYARDVRPELPFTWTVDSLPGPTHPSASDQSTQAVFETLHRLPTQFESRAAFMTAVEADGHARAVSEWLAMNLVRAGEGFRFTLDLDAIGTLLRSYMADDAWPLVTGQGHTHLIIGGASTVYDGQDRDRAARLAQERPNVSATVVPGASHWVHVDSPGPLLAAVVQDLPAQH